MPITNTLENYEKLQEAGIADKHANAIAQVIENAVYKSQEELKYFIKDLFVEFEKKFDAKIDNLEARMETKMLSIKNETLKWMISLAFLSITAIIAIIKFTGP